MMTDDRSNSTANAETKFWKEKAVVLEDQIRALRNEIIDISEKDAEWFFPPLGAYECNSIDEMVDMFGEIHVKASNKANWIGADAAAAFKAQVMGDVSIGDGVERKRAWGILKGKLAERKKCSKRYIDQMIRASMEFPVEYRYPDIDFTAYIRLAAWPYPLTVLGEAVGGDDVWSTRDIDNKKLSRGGETPGARLATNELATARMRMERSKEGNIEAVVTIEYRVVGEMPFRLKPNTPVPVLMSLHDLAPQPDEERRQSTKFKEYQTESKFSDVPDGAEFVWLGNCIYVKEFTNGHNAKRLAPDLDVADFEEDEIVWTKAI